MTPHEKEISYIGTSLDNSSLLASISSKVFHILAKSGSRVRNCMSRFRIIIWINFNLLELCSSKFSSSKLSVKNKEMMFYSYNIGFHTKARVVELRFQVPKNTSLVSFKHVSASKSSMKFVPFCSGAG